MNFGKKVSCTIFLSMAFKIWKGLSVIKYYFLNENISAENGCLFLRNMKMKINIY